MTDFQRLKGKTLKLLKTPFSAIKNSKLVGRNLTLIKNSFPEVKIPKNQEKQIRLELSKTPNEAVEHLVNHKALFPASNHQDLIDSLQSVTRSVRKAQAVGYNPNDLLTQAEELNRYDSSFNPNDSAIKNNRESLLKSLHSVFSKGTNRNDLEQRLFAINHFQSNSNQSLNDAIQRIYRAQKQYDSKPKRRTVDILLRKSTIFGDVLSGRENAKLHPDMLVGVHLTDTLPESGIIKPTSFYRKDAPRNTIHFALNGTVSPANGGAHSWVDKKVAIIVPYSEMRGYITNLMSVDTFGQGKFRLPYDSRVLIEESYAKEHNIQDGQKLGNAQVHVISPDDRYNSIPKGFIQSSYFKEAFSDLPLFHKAVYHNLSQMGYPTLPLTQDCWSHQGYYNNIAFNDIKVLREMFDGKIPPGLTFAHHIGVTPNSISNSSKLSSLSDIIKSRNYFGIPITTNNLLGSYEQNQNSQIQSFVKQINTLHDLVGKNSLERISVKRAAIQEMEQRVKSGYVTDEFNQRKIRSLKEDLSALVKEREIARSVQALRLKSVLNDLMKTDPSKQKEFIKFYNNMVRGGYGKF